MPYDVFLPEFFKRIVKDLKKIYLVDQDGQKVIPLMIYSKSQKQDVTSKELKALLSKLDQELSE